jgi:hypothetical protein
VEKHWILRQFSRARFGSLLWYLTIIVILIWAGVLVMLVRGVAPRGRGADWMEISRGEFLRAVRHRPTGRCFVRHSAGGLVETNADVCLPPR